MGVTVVQAFDELVREFLIIRQVGFSRDFSNLAHLLQRLTLTIMGPSPSLVLPIVSMYFFKSRSTNSNTRYSFWS